MTIKRSLNVEGGLNFRELGGYKTTDGKTVKMHKVIRSGELSNLTTKGKEFLQDYGLKYDVDFRSFAEVDSKPDALPKGVYYDHLPVFKHDITRSSEFDDKASKTKATKGIAALGDHGYDDMIQTYDSLIKLDSSKQAYRKYFDDLLANDKDGHVLLFHCTAGKDRTGMGAVFLLTALGVDKDTIIQDYLLTNKTTKPFADQTLAKVKQASNDPKIYNSIKALLTVSMDYLNTAMTEIKKQSGSLHNYLQEEIKLTPEQVADLKKIYLE